MPGIQLEPKTVNSRSRLLRDVPRQRPSPKKKLNHRLHNWGANSGPGHRAGAGTLTRAVRFATALETAGIVPCARRCLARRRGLVPARASCVCCSAEARACYGGRGSAREAPPGCAVPRTAKTLHAVTVLRFAPPWTVVDLPAGPGTAVARPGRLRSCSRLQESAGPGRGARYCSTKVQSFF